jgi:hypothetical protein
MGIAVEVVLLGKRFPGHDRLKAPGGCVFQSGQRILREGVPQQSQTPFPQLRCWIIGRHIASVAENVPGVGPSVDRGHIFQGLYWK